MHTYQLDSSPDNALRQYIYFKTHMLLLLICGVLFFFISIWSHFFLNGHCLWQSPNDKLAPNNNTYLYENVLFKNILTCKYPKHLCDYFFMFSIYGNWDSERLKGNPYHIRLPVNGKYSEICIFDLNLSYFDFTKKWRTQT